MSLAYINYAAGQDLMQDAFDKTNSAIEVANNISFDGALATIVVQIGDWDMDTDFGKSVTHGIADYKKIRNVSVVIRDDSDTTYYHDSYTNTGTTNLGFGVNTINSTTINLVRVTTGDFDSTGFDSTSFNRGWLTITYEV